MSEPETIYAGTTVSWTVPAGDYPAPIWTLSYALISKDKETISITAVPDGDGHKVNELPAITSGWVSGEYYWQRSVTDGADTFVTGRGRMQVLPNYADTTVDPRSSAKITLDALIAVRENKATSDQLAMSLNGRSISRMSWSDLNDAVRHFKRLVEEEEATERDERGLRSLDNTIKVSIRGA